ncbi:MAG: LapA family protein [Nitrospirae bacterium]|nr:LapA family protein [Nitrospirota bacterium]
MIRLIFSLIILTIVFILAMVNKEPVQINYLLGSTSQLPLYMILIGAFIAGGIVFSLLLLPAWIKNKIEIRKLRRSIKDIETENN